MFKKILALCLCVFMVSSLFLMTGVSADSAEMRVFYDPCHSFDNVWSSYNMTVKDDVIGEANYNNGGKMIGMADKWEFNIVYKVPEGRSFKSFFAEISTQNVSDVETVKLAYSEDGTTYTDYEAGWGSSLGAPGTGLNDAGWSRKYARTVTAPENKDVKFIKLYHGGAGMDNVNKFNLRKVSMLTVGGEITSDTVVDELTGDDAEIYEISNINVYDLINSADATAIANIPDKFTDSNVLGIKDKSKDAYMIYKVEDNRILTNFEVQTLEKDTGGAVTAQIYASSDGINYDFITNTGKSIMDRIDSDPASTADHQWVGYNSLISIKSALSADDAYKYVKVFVKGGTAGSVKLSNIKIETVDMSKGCLTGDVYEEEFDSEMYHINDSKNAGADGSKLTIAADGYVTYKALPAREIKRIELVASGSKTGVLEALDVNKNKIAWNTEITTESSGSNTIISSDVPDGAAYVKISGDTVLKGITVETDDAIGSEWTYIDGTPSLTAELSGKPLDKLESGCTVSFNIPIKNTGSEPQDAKVYICVFEGDRMDKIEEFDADIDAGAKITATGLIDVATVTEKTSVTVFLWTDLDSMIALGTEQVFGNK